MSSSIVVVLVEEEEMELVDLVDANSRPFNEFAVVRRPGRFIKPRAASPEDGGGVPLVQPLLREVVSAGLVKRWPPEVLFRGWSSPTPRWDQWVWKMRSLHGKLWMESGIHDAVVASTCGFQRDDATMLGLVECWCPETSTFVLPWPSMGVEATVSLEDVMIMGGFPVLGEPVGPPAAPLAGEAGELVEALDSKHRRLTGQRGLPHVSNAEWMDHHMQAQAGVGGSPLEHAAFLTLWLSRFVFPSSCVQRRVFPIAARLAMGRRIALAPAVLASLYRDLRLMKQEALAVGVSNEAAQIVVWAPFHILQLWAWERFGSLRPENTPRFLRMDEPRAARWRCFDAGTRDLSTVRSVLESPAEFRWRPYADNVDNWGRPPYYKQVGRWFTIGARDNGSLPSLLHCMRAGGLAGLDCVERYAPHRVGMQFGFDQDLPGWIPCADADWELTWSAYDRGSEEAKLYVPSQLCKPRATMWFLKWQQEWMSERMVEVEKIALEQVAGVSKRQLVDSEKEHYRLGTKRMRSKCVQKASMAAATAGEQAACMAEDGMSTNNLSPSCTEEKAIQNDVDSKAMETENSNGDEAHHGNHLESSFQENAEDLLGEKYSDAYTENETQKNDNCEPIEIDGETDSDDEFNSDFQKSAEDVGEDCEDYDHEQLEQFIVQELEKVDPPRKTEKKKFVIDVELERQKDLEFEKESRQIKAEIAVLEERLKVLQSEGPTAALGSEED